MFFTFQAAEDSQFCQALRYQNRSKGLVWHYMVTFYLLKSFALNWWFHLTNDVQMIIFCVSYFNTTVCKCSSIIYYIVPLDLKSQWGLCLRCSSCLGIQVFDHYVKIDGSCRQMCTLQKCTWGGACTYLPRYLKQKVCEILSKIILNVWLEIYAI